MTIVELLMALASTALIASAIASMLFAVARATDDRNDQRGLLMRHKLLGARLDAAVRASKKVLAVGSNYLVLWMGDTRANDLPDLSELRRVEFDSTTGQLRSYKASFPVGWTQAQIDAADTGYTLSTDFAATTASLKGTSTFPSETWCTGVTTWSAALNHATAQSATLVSYRATITLGSGSSAVSGSVVGAAALRNP